MEAAHEVRGAGATHPRYLLYILRETIVKIQANSHNPIPLSYQVLLVSNFIFIQKKKKKKKLQVTSFENCLHENLIVIHVTKI